MKVTLGEDIRRGVTVLSNPKRFKINAQSESGARVWFEILESDLSPEMVKKLEATGLFLKRPDGGFVWLNPNLVSHFFVDPVDGQTF